MKNSAVIYMAGQIVDDDVELTLVDMSRISGASAEEITLWVAEGAFEPKGAGPQEWRFSGASLCRALTAFRLARDLQINAPGIALALDLLDEIEALKTKSKR
ncbi:Chaperone modulatory protein CbpM [Paraburkholderia caffeinitolerans]|uniref:Chaperone modulatory protein CbpM n=1 Tax=Paraburkholderia caffeinitolerans TaxID=1723730 RepID=A0A6J5GPB7_9BURK|nr:chaperone modulator CbpM [Paraburkholderia caffeinitolerans]CAB3804732.1 Chaperone modulatory protein CbpM [Paraburkholderia caffeinitolerans]